MISPAEAEAAIGARAPRLPGVSMPLKQLSGKILREPIVAAMDQPPFDRVTMDGIALASQAYERGRRTFRIIGTQAAGAAPLTLHDPSACLEVMTGAMLPEGCDCVVPVENITIAEGAATLADAAPGRGLNIHPRGIDCKSGTRLLEPGMTLGAAEVAVIASQGQAHATVSSPPRIAIISTGDELVEPGQPRAAWQIYRSNAYGVLTALQRRGLSQLTLDHLPDDQDTLRTRLRKHLDTHDVLILSGGVSMGRFDYIPQVLGELGIDVVFHKVAQRPGKPLWFGVGAGGRAVYALPGNPVSTLVCLVRYVLAGLEAAQGTTRAPTETVELAEDYEVSAALTLFIPVKVQADGGSRRAHPRATHGSGDFTSLIGTDGFVELSPGRQVRQGTVVPLYRW